MGPASDAGADAGSDAGTDAGADAGTDAGTDPYACTTCASGWCIPGGGCAECRAKADCGAGRYCTAQWTCATGACGIGADCKSGWCLETHECEDCSDDAECSPGNYCGTGKCTQPCVDSCPTPGLTCCTGRCVDLARDIAHCGACTKACAATEFCTGVTCATTSFENICANPRVTVVHDSQGMDRVAGVQIGNALQGCAPDGGQLRFLEGDSDAGIFDTASGRLITRGGETLVATGGPVVQKISQYLEDNGLVPVHFLGATGQRNFVGPDGGVLVSAMVDETPQGVNAGHDFFLLQLGREPYNGSFSLSAYGFGGAGTSAAGWYFVNQILPTRLGRADRWYVVEWTDLNANFVPDAPTEFIVRASGN